MAKLLIQSDFDPAVCIIITDDEQGYGGDCTQCGHCVHHHRQDDALEEAEIHIDRHDGELSR